MVASLRFRALPEGKDGSLAAARANDAGVEFEDEVVREAHDRSPRPAPGLPLQRDLRLVLRELHGRYTPPLGTIGSALDSLIDHRVAYASLHRFVTDVASLLRGELAAG